MSASSPATNSVSGTVFHPTDATPWPQLLSTARSP
jgi:hypothetical protein